MAKFYTVVRPLPASDDTDVALYAHVLGKDAFSKLGRCTTAKREIEEDSGWDLLNWSYKVDGDLPPAGSKVYVVLQKLVVANGNVLYFQAGPDTGYLTRKAATKAKKALANAGLTNLVIFSFIIDKPAEPEIREFTVTRTVMARSQEEAEMLAWSPAGMAA